jgi:hypothetical protein
MHYAAYLTALAAFALPPLAAAEGLYSKSSAVLQLDEKSYDKLVKKSTQASVRPERPGAWEPAANTC